MKMNIVAALVMLTVNVAYGQHRDSKGASKHEDRGRSSSHDVKNRPRTSTPREDLKNRPHNSTPREDVENRPHTSTPREDVENRHVRDYPKRENVRNNSNPARDYNAKQRQIPHYSSPSFAPRPKSAPPSFNLATQSAGPARRPSADSRPNLEEFAAINRDVRAPSAPQGYSLTNKPPSRDLARGAFNDQGLIGEINRNNYDETNSGGFWRHKYGRYDYCHYRDRDYDLYGWYAGLEIYWTCRRGNHWLWWDPMRRHWAWYDEYWWDQDIVGVVHVYSDDGGYSNYENSETGVVLTPQPPVPGSGESGGQKVFYSKDGLRSVQIIGPNKDAYLYDTASPPAFDARWLANGVTNVIFKYDGEDKLIEILTQDEQGESAIFNVNGGQTSPKQEPSGGFQPPIKPSPNFEESSPAFGLLEVIEGGGSSFQ